MADAVQNGAPCCGNSRTIPLPWSYGKTFCVLGFPAKGLIHCPRETNWPSLTVFPKHCSNGKSSAVRTKGGLRLRRVSSLQIRAATVENEEVKWWEKCGGSNMHDIHSTQEFLDALSKAGDKLVIAEFYGTWCGSCRALFPRLCKLAAEHPDIVFLKVNFDENKSMCKSLNIKVLPYFHFYRGADGRLEAFSCSLAKFQRLKDAIALHNTARCSIGPPLGVGDIDLLGTTSTNDKSTAAGTR